MWLLTACKVSVSSNWVKNKRFFLSYLWINVGNIINSEIKKHFIFDPVQEQETNWNSTGCQVQHFMILLIPYMNLPNFFKLSIFEEYGAFPWEVSELLFIFWHSTKQTV